MKKVIFIIAAIITFVIVSNFFTSIYTLWHKKGLLIIAKNQLQKEERENVTLKGELAQVKSTQFVEEEARNKLFLAKPGESQLVIPTITLKTAENKKPEKKPAKPNWQQWVDVFFH